MAYPDSVIRMVRPPDVVICSYRLGGRDGVSIEAAKWIEALRQIGCAVRTVAGEGDADVLVPGLGADDLAGPERGDLLTTLGEADLVIVENLCSLPLNPAAGEAVAQALVSRPAILHHHDLAIERPEFARFGAPPNDAAWLHVCVNDLARQELARRGYLARTCYNRFDPNPPAGDRMTTRRQLGIGTDEHLVLQPTRAIPRKNVAGGIALSEALGAVYWLTGAAEDGFGGELDRLIDSAAIRVLRSPMPGTSAADAYAACDLVVLPSTWEGFGNPAIESATHRRPLAIGRYPVAEELRAHGFSWFGVDDPGPIAAFLTNPDGDLLEANASIARSQFSLDELPDYLERLMTVALAPDRSKTSDAVVGR